MKSFLIIGMGRFGHHICDNLLALGNDIMVVDRDEAKVEDLVYRVTNVQIGDCTDPDVVKSLGVGNFDMVLVCIGTNFQSSLEITWLVKSMGAKYVVSKANRDVHAQFLLRNGADEVIYPDRDIAEKIAKAYSADSIFDYFQLDDGYSMYEIAMVPEWVGRSLRVLDIRKKYKINVVGMKTLHGDEFTMNIVPDPDYILLETDRLIVVGKEKDVEDLLHISGDNSPNEKLRKKVRRQK